MTTKRAALVSICHGAGPLPLLNCPDHTSLVYHLNNDIPKVLKLGTPQAPKAIVLVTAHWQTKTPTVSGGETHDLLYDYYGFPEESYNIKYEADGAPDVAARVVELLRESGMKARIDNQRGWDHGTFIPMKLINPSGSVPIVQMSVLASQDPSELLRVGSALTSIRDENIAIIGSGSPSYHNLETWFSTHDDEFKQRQADWQSALDDAVQIKEEADRTEALKNWRSLPHSLEMHPHCNSEHFSTLLVCVGAAGGARIHCGKFELAGAEQTTHWWE